METPAAPPAPSAPRCWSCSGPVDASDKYCRHCGKGQGAQIPWYYGHFGIIILSLVALGPFGLFLVWRSPRLTLNARAVYTALILAYTWWLGSLLYSLYQVLMTIFNANLGGFY